MTGSLPVFFFESAVMIAIKMHLGEQNEILLPLLDVFLKILKFKKHWTLMMRENTYMNNILIC